MPVTDGVLPGDVYGTKADGVYVPNVGVVPLQGGTVSSDSQSPPQPSAPALVQLSAGATLIGVVQLADGTTSTQKLAIDSSGRLTLVPNQVMEIGDGTTPTQKLAIDSSGRLTLVPNQVVEIGDGTTPTQKLAIDSSGRLTILSIANALPAGTNTLGGVSPVSAATGGYTYTNITSATTTLIKSGAGTLHSIVVNTPVGSGVIEMDDALTHTTPKIGTITFPATILSIGYLSNMYDIAFTTGLSITTTGTMDITVAWK